MGVSCSCPGARGLPGYCRGKGETPHPQDQVEGQCQIQAPTSGLPGGALGPGEEEDQRGTLGVSGMADQRYLVEWKWNLNLGVPKDLFVVGFFLVLAFS